MIRSSRGFTLIELLIVIAIIGILMALLFPAVNSAIDAARRAQAKNDVTQLATAVTAYETEYGRLPGSGNNDSKIKVSKDLIETLTATGNGTNDNPRKITFIEINTWKKGKSGTNSSGDFKDPWDGEYWIGLDYDYDNTLSGVGTNGTNIRKKVAVWNKPSTQTGNPSTSQQGRRYVNSWE